ncbi:retrovirus-related pol polyprotein from transposon TNT 1-94 [Tanacetum coccineum]
MSTQQDIYAASSENCPPILNKENYVPWSSRLLCYAKSRPNGKLIYNSIINGPYVRRMIPKTGDENHEVAVNETFHEQIDDELTEKELKQVEADDQAIQTILLGLPEDIYAAVDSCETAQEIRFTSTNGESIESYYHRFSKLMNDFKRNKHFPEKIASNLKFLNNLQPEWSRHVTIVHQTKDLHTTDYTQLYDFLKYNQKEVNELRAEQLGKTHDPLALMANSNNPYNFLVFHQDQPSPSTHMQQQLPNNNIIPQPSLNQNYMQQPMKNPKDITDPTTAMNMALALMAKAFKLNYSTPTNNNQRISSNPRNRQIAQPGNQNGYNIVQNPSVQNVGNQSGLIVVSVIANQNPNRNGNVVTALSEGNAIGNNEAGIQLQAEEFDLMAAAGDLNEIEEVNANCILMANLQQASTSGTQTVKAPIYDSYGSAEVQLYENCYDNEIFNMFTLEEHMEQNRGTLEQCHANVEEAHALYDSLYNNLATDVEKVNSVNRKMKATNAELTTELARYKNQEKFFEINQEKYDKLERCYQNSVYQKQHLIKKINALHLSSAKTITTLNEEIANLNNMLSKEKSTVSSLQEEKKRLKSDFKIREDELLDKQIQLENKIKKTLELEIDRLLRAIVSQEIMSIVQNNYVVDTSNLLTKLERMKERFENSTIKKETEYAKLWNNWYKKCQECKYDKISYDNSYNDMQQNIERLQAQLGDLKGKCKDTPGVSDTLDPLSQKLENENMELEFHVVNYLRAQLFDKASKQKDKNKGTSVNTKFANQSILGKPFLQPTINNFVIRQPNAFKSERPNFLNNRVPQKVDKTNDLSKPVTSNLVPITNESNVVKNDNVIALGMFRIDPRKTSKEDKFVPINNVRASVRTNLITISQPHVITKKDVNSDSNSLSSTGVDNNVKTRRTQPRSNTKNDRVPSASKSRCFKNNAVEVEEHHRNSLLSKNKKHMSSQCNNVKLAIWNDNFDVVCAICCSKHMTRNLKLLINFVWMFMGTVRFRNDHVATILGYGDLQWGNILITRVYFVKGLGHNLFSVGQFFDLDLELAFRRNTCFVKNLEGVDLLKGNHTTNLYTINLHEMASASPICLMARTTSTKSLLWHQRLSHLNFDTINDLARNDLVTCLPKFKYHKEHLCPSCEQGKSKRASHPPKLVPNSKQRLLLFHMDLCGLMRIASINGKRSKDEAPEVIKTFLKKIQVLLQAQVIIVRTDNGTEFKNQVLQEYFDSVGISHQASSVRTPQ